MTVILHVIKDCRYLNLLISTISNTNERHYSDKICSNCLVHFKISQIFLEWNWNEFYAELVFKIISIRVNTLGSFRYLLQFFHSHQFRWSTAPNNHSLIKRCSWIDILKVMVLIWYHFFEILLATWKTALYS